MACHAVCVQSRSTGSKTSTGCTAAATTATAAAAAAATATATATVTANKKKPIRTQPEFIKRCKVPSQRQAPTPKALSPNLTP